MQALHELNQSLMHMVQQRLNGFGAKISGHEANKPNIEESARALVAHAFTAIRKLGLNPEEMTTESEAQYVMNFLEKRVESITQHAYFGDFLGWTRDLDESSPTEFNVSLFNETVEQLRIFKHDLDEVVANEFHGYVASMAGHITEPSIDNVVARVNRITRETVNHQVKNSFRSLDILFRTTYKVARPTRFDHAHIEKFINTYTRKDALSAMLHAQIKEYYGGCFPWSFEDSDVENDSRTGFHYVETRLELSGLAEFLKSLTIDDLKNITFTLESRAVFARKANSAIHHSFEKIRAMFNVEHSKIPLRFTSNGEDKFQDNYHQIHVAETERRMYWLHAQSEKAKREPIRVEVPQEVHSTLPVGPKITPLDRQFTDKVSNLEREVKKLNAQFVLLEAKVDTSEKHQNDMIEKWNVEMTVKLKTLMDDKTILEGKIVALQRVATKEIDTNETRERVKPVQRNLAPRFNQAVVAPSFNYGVNQGPFRLGFNQGPFHHIFNEGHGNIFAPRIDVSTSDKKLKIKLARNAFHDLQASSRESILVSKSQVKDAKHAYKALKHHI